MKPNTLYLEDCLELMSRMEGNFVDLIYLDPPFNSNRNYQTHDGEVAFSDFWKWSKHCDSRYLKIKLDLDNPSRAALIGLFQILGQSSMMSYLFYMAERLVECKKVLKDTGSIYLHCDSTASHYLKVLMDKIFGSNNFRNEIVWYYGGRGAKAISRQFSRNKDVILYYTMNNGNHRFNKQSNTHRYTLEESIKKGFRKDEKGRWFKTSPRGDYTDKSIERLRKEDRVYKTKTGSIRIKYFLETSNRNNQVVIENKLIDDLWFDIPDAMHMPKKEKTGYPTQKPLELLRRIIKASSNEGDLVLDPFCGSGTTLEAAEQLDRKWIGIDVFPQALNISEKRLKKYKSKILK